MPGTLANDESANWTIRRSVLSDVFDITGVSQIVSYSLSFDNLHYLILRAWDEEFSART